MASNKEGVTLKNEETSVAGGLAAMKKCNILYINEP